MDVGAVDTMAITEEETLWILGVDGKSDSECEEISELTEEELSAFKKLNTGQAPMSWLKDSA